MAFNKFPEITGKTLSGKEITIPNDLEEDIALIGIAFKRQVQEMLDSWSQPFNNAFREEKNIGFYEIPMIDSKIWKFFSGFIDSGMRSGIPKEKHDYVLTYYGNTEEYQNQLSIEEKSLAYVYLIDKQGNIKWSGKGFSEQEEIDQLLNRAEDLIG